MRNFFVFNGINSIDLDIYIQSKSVYSAPKYDVTLTSIAGRNGDLPNPNGRFPNGTVSYTCFVPAKSIGELAEKMTAVKNWLYSGVGKYHELTDSYDTRFLRYALFNSKLDIAEEAQKIGTFTVTFSVKPFRYLKEGLVPQTYTQNFTLVNPYAFTAKPYLKIYGHSGTLTINEHLWQIVGIDGYIECDSELMNWYKGTESKNNKAHGDGFPELAGGETAHISFSGGITAIEIIPRWVSL